MVHSIAGLIAKRRPDPRPAVPRPHHSASMAALTGGGLRAKPGEVSLAHNGVLFLDELPEFSAQALDSLRAAAGDRRGDGRPRQRPRALSGPGAAGGGDEPLPLRPRRPGPRRLRKAPALPAVLPVPGLRPADRPHRPAVEVPPVTAADLALPPPAEGSAEAAARVAAARALQADRAERGRRGRRAASTPAPRARWLEQHRRPGRARPRPCWPRPPRPAA